jgi:hypothetical protein
MFLLGNKFFKNIQAIGAALRGQFLGGRGEWAFWYLLVGQGHNIEAL